MISMRKVAGLAMIGLLASAALAQDAGTSRSPAKSTVAMLAQKVGEVAFEDAPLDTFIEWLASYTQMNVVVRWQVLEDMGIERDKPISLNLKNLSLSQVLWMAMNEVGGAEVKLAYRATGDLIILSTEDDLGEEMLVKVYDVSDLLVRQRDFTNAPRINLSQQSGGGQGGGGQNVFSNSGGGGQNDNDNENQNTQDGQINQQMQDLINLIVATVEPDSWIDNGGVGTITAFGRQLVIRNNLLVHQALGGAVRDSE